MISVEPGQLYKAKKHIHLRVGLSMAGAFDKSFFLEPGNVIMILSDPECVKKYGWRNGIVSVNVLTGNRLASLIYWNEKSIWPPARFGAGSRVEGRPPIGGFSAMFQRVGPWSSEL